MNRTIPYEMIRNSAPDGKSKKKRPKGKLKAWQGLAYYAIVFLILVLFGGVFSSMTGRYTTEVFLQQIFFLGTALLAVFVFRAGIGDVFPLKKPKGAAVGGIFVLMIGFFLIAYVYSLLVLYFAPGALENASENMDKLLHIPSLPLEILLTALCPAICEEAMFRGVILHSFRNSLGKWTAIILSALLFGVMHMTPVRMFMPAVLGILIALIVLETGNMFYGSLLHFSYNAILTLLSRWAEGFTNGGEDLYLETLSGPSVGLCVMAMGIFIPFLLWLGLWLIRRSTAPRIPDLFPKGEIRKTLLRILLPTCGIIFLGIVVFFI